MFWWVVTLLIIYISIKWYLRSLWIRRNYGDLYVLVTGCDSGFGRELLFRLDELGFNVYATCLNEKNAVGLNKATSLRTKTVQLDVKDTKAISKLYQMVKDSIPKDKVLWGVVNNAGVMLPICPCAVLTRLDYQESLDINFFSMVEINRQFIPLLVKSKGRIVNISSMTGRIAMGFTPYVVSKYAVEGYSDCLRSKLYHQGVTVNVLEPGGFATNLAKSTTKAVVQQGYSEIMNNLSEKMREYYGTKYCEKVGGKLERYKYSKALYKVVDAYVHALTARCPKIRYIVGTDANTIFRFLYMCPEWISDFVIAKKGIESVRPTGRQNNLEDITWITGFASVPRGQYPLTFARKVLWKQITSNFPGVTSFLK